MKEYLPPTVMQPGFKFRSVSQDLNSDPLAFKTQALHSQAFLPLTPPSVSFSFCIKGEPNAIAPSAW